MATSEAGGKLLAAALAYAQKGWGVFACEPRGKRPLTDHGLKEATTDEQTIRAWWTRWPEANIGHPTGRYLVLDLDGAEGERALANLETKHGKLPVTAMVKTGKGRHLYFTPNGPRIRNSAGKLGPHLDIRGEGGYVILPPSEHENGRRYVWEVKEKPAPLPAWIRKHLAEPERAQPRVTSASKKIGEGQRHAHLLKLAGTLRSRGCDEATITAALLAENASRCEPPKPECDVRALADDLCTRYAAGAPDAKTELNPWSEPEGLEKFLESGEDGADFLDREKRILARASITEIFSPRGLGKSLFALWLALQLALRELRVLYIDRDNPRHVVRSRLKSFGAETTTPGLKIISREKCPPLTNTVAWALFPYADYDVVILDSFDSAAEGIGEQDSAKPSRAIAPVLDIARREKGPAVLILGNCVRTAKHSRGSGIVEDRADIVYEVRDATEFHASGSKPWAEELPIVGAEGWAGRASRRKQREKFRLGFVASKFRIGVEPEPFVLEIDLTTDPWRVGDVTNDVDREGAEAREQRARERAEKFSKAKAALEAEILRRDSADEPPMLKDRDAVSFLTAKPHSLRRTDARDVVNNPEGHWVLAKIDSQKGHPIGLLPLGKNREDGGNKPVVGTGLKGRHFHRFERKHSAPVLRSTDTSAWLDEKTASSFAIAV